MTRRLHLFPHALLLLLAWGAFAFGSEFTWAYAPLLVFSVAVSALGLLAGARQPESTFKTYRSLILALALLFAAAVVQVIPLPPSVIERLSPARNNADYAKLYAERDLREVDPSALQQPARTLSIEPSRTYLGLMFLACLSLLLIGTARGFGGIRPTNFVRGVVVLGVVAAFAEIIQKSTGSSIVYGFFSPRQLGYFSAPFVNRNHTAGWLVMVLSLTLGHLAGCLATSMRGVKPEWRTRLLWLSTRRASEALLIAFGATVMAIAIVLTESRSGTLCLLVVSMIFGWLSLRGQASWVRRIVAVSHVVVLIAVAAAIGGEAVTERFAEGKMENLDGRLDLWRDTSRIIEDYSATGTGLNTYGISMLNYQRVDDGRLYIEAHNDYLQLVAEGGILLSVPAICVCLVVARKIRHRYVSEEDDPRLAWIRTGAITGVTGILMQSVFDFTLQMVGASVMFIALIGLAVHRPIPIPSSSN